MGEDRVGRTSQEEEGRAGGGTKMVDAGPPGDRGIDRTAAERLAGEGACGLAVLSGTGLRDHSVGKMLGPICP